jgi:thioredoxin reductase
VSGPPDAIVDVIVVGGGAAGLSAALVFGRSRRRTLVLDAGQPRNAPSSAAHSVFTRDGTPPGELLSIGREQLRPYPSVELRAGEAADARVVEGGIEVSVADGSTVRARRLLLAFGVIDDLPEVEGIEALWGRSVLHCPYCHGWEVRDQPLALYGRGKTGIQLAQLLCGWSDDLVLCTNGPAKLSAEEREQLARHGVQVREERIVRLEGNAGLLARIVFADGSDLARSAMFLRPPQRLRSDLAARLGCELTDHGLIQTDEWGRTSVHGVYAAGDAATPLQQVIRAAASGASAAIAINHALLVEDFD